MGEAIFREYDREGLDREYNNRAKVADFADYLARYPRESAATRESLPCRLGLAYGPSPAETLDVFLPPGPGPAPVQIFIHGGYWMALDKADFSFVARALQPAGAMVVVINYALIPAVDMDELVRQCRTAVAWVHRNARAFGGNPDRVFVSGHSAGGHLVAMCMATDWTAFGAPSDAIKGGVAISGLFDLEPIRLCYLNDTLKLTPESVRRNSPIHLRPSTRAPLALLVGEPEGPEYHRQTEEQAAAWGQHGVPVKVKDLSAHHFSIITQLEDPRSKVARQVLRQMGLAMPA
jgi:arylformamidase